MPQRAATLTIRPGEGRRVALLLGLSFCLGVVEVLLYAASRSVFLARYGSSDLPLVYVGVALAVTACSLCFGLLQRRVANGPLLLAMLTALAASLAGFRLWLDAGGGAWAALLLAVWFDVVFILSSLAFWGLAGALFDVRQAKRLYGLIGSGEYLATVLTGLASPWLARQVGAENLLWPAAGALCAGLVLGAALVRETGRAAPRRETGPVDDAGAAVSAGPGVRSYLTGMHLVWGLAICGLFLTDLVLNTQAEAHAASMVDTASFFGRFYAVAGALVLLARLTVSGRVLMAMGPVNTLILLPGALSLMTLALVSGTTLLTQAVPLVFWLAVGCRLLDYVLRYSFHKPAFMILYQPLPASRRLAAQATVEGLAEPAAILAVGLLLLAGRRIFPLDVVNVAWLLLAVLAAWQASLLLVRRRYRDVLMAALRRGRVSTDMDLVHPQARRALLERLASADPSEAVPAMDLLLRHAPSELGPALPGLLARPEPELLLEVLERLSRPGPASPAPAVPDAAVGAVRAMAENHEDPAVRGAALAALAALAPDSGTAGPGAHAAGLLLAALDHAEPEVRLGAAAGLARLGSGDGTGADPVRDRLETLAASPEAARRLEAARMAGAAGRFASGPAWGTVPVLTRLLDDADPEVARAALDACQGMHCGDEDCPDLARALLAMARRTGMRARAVRALAAVGLGALPALEEAMDDAGADRRARLAAVRAVARMGGAGLARGDRPGNHPTEDMTVQLATAALVMRLDVEDNELRGAVCAGLAAMGWQASRRARPVLAEAMRAEVARAAWCLECRHAMSGEAACGPMARALEEEADGAAQRLLTLLALDRPSEALDRARRRLAHPDAAQRALALEMLENLLSQADKRLMLPLLLPEESDQRLVLLRAALGPQAEPPGGWLAAAVSGLGGLLPWTRATALHCLAGSAVRDQAASRTALASALEAARDAQRDSDALVAETARMAVQSMTP